MRLATLSVLLLICGCIHGPRVSTYPPARSPSGLDVTLGLRDEPRRIRGELLAVRDTSLVVATTRAIYEVSYDRISTSRFTNAQRLRVGAGRAPGPRKREELRLLSRYPQGISEALLEEILEAYGVTEVEVIR